MIIGLKNLEYLNSQGLAFLISLIKRVEDLGGVFLIGGVNKLIETINAKPPTIKCTESGVNNDQLNRQEL